MKFFFVEIRWLTLFSFCHLLNLCLMFKHTWDATNRLVVEDEERFWVTWNENSFHLKSREDTFYFLLSQFYPFFSWSRFIRFPGKKSVMTGILLHALRLINLLLLLLRFWRDRMKESHNCPLKKEGNESGINDSCIFMTIKRMSSNGQKGFDSRNKTIHVAH